MPNDATFASPTDNLDELSAFGHTDQPVDVARTLTDMVERNPVPAALAAAAAGAGLMALLALMVRRDPEPFAPIPTVAPRAIDYDALKKQIADLTDRIANVMPIDTAKQRAAQAGDAIADSWSTVRDTALDAIDRLQPQATAAIKVARENPIWTALIVGAVGAIAASQFIGGKTDAAPGEPQSDPSADA